MKHKQITDIVQEMETDYIRGSTQSSRYVNFSMYETIERINAYLASKHISGEKDSQGRPKPFFNIVTSAANIWMRATDIDRKHIRLSAKNSKNWLESFFATVLLQDWMRRENFGQFLNEWGRTLARFGSAVVEFVENSEGLHISVLPWNRLIVDPVSFDPNPKIKILELTEGELRRAVKERGYDKAQVDALIDAKTSRETIGKQRKDNKSDYYKLYETKGYFSKALLTGSEADEDIFEEQLWVISYVGGKKKGEEDESFVLFKGEIKPDTMMITHLIREDDRTLAIGAVEHLFEAQWMQNHSAKAIKDRLDISSKLMWQTTDANFIGRNLFESAENGDVVVTLPNGSLTEVQAASPDTSFWQNYALAWRDLGREVVGISEAMVGVAPKAGTAWRQLESQLSESYSLFELMTENKGLYLEQMLRRHILPYLFKKYDNADEISAVLEKHDITRLDAMYIKSEAIRYTNKKILENVEQVLSGETDEIITQDQAGLLTQENEQNIQQGLQQLGNQRFFKPSEVSWKKQFEDVEWDIDIDVTGEEYNIQEVMTTLNTALKIMVTPGYDQRPDAKAVVSRVLDMTGAMSALEYNALPIGAPAQGPTQNAEFTPPTRERNISNKK